MNKIKFNFNINFNSHYPHAYIIQNGNYIHYLPYKKYILTNTIEPKKIMQHKNI